MCTGLVLYVLHMARAGGGAGGITGPQSMIRSPFSGPRFVLALAGHRRPVVQIRATDKDDLIAF